MIKKTNFKWILVFGVVILILLSFFQIYRVNTKYPNPEIIIYQEEEPIRGGDVTITVMESSLAPAKEVTRDFEGYVNVVSEVRQLSKDQEKILLVELRAENTSLENQTVNLTQFVAQSGVWSNGWDLELYFLLNNTGRIEVELEPLSNKTVYLGYCLYDFQFSGKEWTRVENRDFNLVMTVYPYKNQVCLNVI